MRRKGTSIIKIVKARMSGRKEDDERKKERGMRNMKFVREERARKPMETEKAVKRKCGDSKDMNVTETNPGSALQ